MKIKGTVSIDLLLAIIFFIVFNMVAIPVIQYGFLGQKVDFNKVKTMESRCFDGQKYFVGDDTISPVLDSVGNQIPCNEMDLPHKF